MPDLRDFNFVWLTFSKSKSPRGDRAQNRQITTHHHDEDSVGAAARRRVLSDKRFVAYQKRLFETS